MKQAKCVLSLLLSLCLVLGLIPGTAFAASNNLPFTDVNTTNWFYDAVQYTYDKGMMSGTSATTFSPNGTTTRGMIVTVLHRMEGTPKATGMSFEDVPAGQWYSNAVAWASENGVVSGYGNGKFGPGNAITREQMATILYRYSQNKGYDTTKSSNISAFSDAAQVSSYAAEGMKWAIGSGLISGVGNNRLEPKGNASRAQVATILMRYSQNVVPSETEPDSTYTVTFDLNYGSNTQYDVKTVKAEKTVSKPANPSRSGYSFDGWYETKSGGRQFDFNSAITKNTVLYAHWSTFNNSSSSSSCGSSWFPSGSNTTIYYTVTFNANGGSVENLPQAQTVKAGEYASEPAAPSREDHVFGGWFTDPTCTSGFSFTAAITSNITLYAKWSASDTTVYYTVTFNANGENVENVPAAQQVKAGGCAVTPVRPSREGYAFSGWYTDMELANIYSFDTAVSTDLTLYAGWTATTSSDKPGEDETDKIYAKTVNEEHITEGELEYGGEIFTAMYVDNMIILETESGVTKSQIEQLASEYQGTIVGYIETLGYYQVELESTLTLVDLNTLVGELKANKLVSDAYLNTISELEENLASVYPNDPWGGSSFDEDHPDGYNWGIEAINVRSAWDILDKHYNKFKIFQQLALA